VWFTVPRFYVPCIKLNALSLPNRLVLINVVEVLWGAKLLPSFVTIFKTQPVLLLSKQRKMFIPDKISFLFSNLDSMQFWDGFLLQLTSRIMHLLF
jgi:hypothetical protein